MRGFRLVEPSFGLGAVLDPWRALDRALQGVQPEPSGRWPAVNAWTGPHGTIVTAALPGVDPATLDVQVQGETLTFRGERAQPEGGAEAVFHRRERPYGAFSRSVALPYPVDATKVQARLVNGLLRIELPRLEADRPRRIQVQA